MADYSLWKTVSDAAFTPQRKVREISGLARYSMAKLEAGQTFSIHGLVQAVERYNIAAEEHPRVIERAADLLMSWAPRNSWQFENWASWRILLPHARELWYWQKKRESVRPNLAFLDNFGGFLEFQGAYAEAEPVLRLALEAGERSLGAEHPDVLSSLHNLAEFL